MTVPTNDMLMDVPGAADIDRPVIADQPAPTADSRFRMGHPRLMAQDTTVSDATAARRIIDTLPTARRPAFGAADAPLAPRRDDPIADAKRLLGYKPSTGFNFVTGARFKIFLKSDFDMRIVDGAAMIAAIDQDFVPDPIKAPDTTAPGISYLRLGKGETPLLDGKGNALERRHDMMKDQKENSGIGLFSDGALNAWTRQPLSFRSDTAFYITSPAYSLSSYGESKIITYELQDADDIIKVNSGKVADVGVDRKIINVNWLRSTRMGWYRQIFDRGKALSYTTSNKGDFGMGAAYSLSAGAKFEHAISVGLSTSYAGKVDISKGFSMEIGATGATFKHPFGAWTQEMDAEVSAYSSVSLSVAGIDTLPIKTAMTIFSVALHVSVAAQSAAFIAYNAVVAGKADKTLTAEHAKDKGDDTHGLLTALEEGVTVYETAIALSAVTCAAGCVMAAFQAYWAAGRVPDPISPSIEVSRQGIFLRYGTNGIEIGPAGVSIVGLAGGVIIGGPMVRHMAPMIDHVPIPPMPILPKT